MKFRNTSAGIIRENFRGLHLGTEDACKPILTLFVQ